MDENNNNPTEMPEIPEFLRLKKAPVETNPEVPVELEREFVSIEQPGGVEVQPKE